MVASARMMFAEFFVWLAEPARSLAPHLDGAHFSSMGLSDTGPFKVCATAKPVSAATPTSNATRTALPARACLIGRLPASNGLKLEPEAPAHSSRARDRARSMPDRAE